MKNWFSDNGDGTFNNPVLYTDYSDPDAIRVGEDYFMTASSFCNTPGLPILHSRDLVNWKVINYALQNIPYERYAAPCHGCGVWAPALRYHEGEFILFFPMPDEGIFVVRTKDPWGEWSEPVALFEGAGWIDPCPFWDEDGRAYMVNAFARSRIGFKSILQITEMKPDCSALIGESRYVFDGNTNDQVTIEGPKLYKRNGYYYIFAPAGGVKQGWQVILRSRDIFGPYEYRVVCEQKDTFVNGPHQGAWVDTPGGQDWFLHFQDVYAAGRIVHLQPMRWEADWPVIGEAAPGEICGKPVNICPKPEGTGQYHEIFAPDVSDEFDGERLGLQWQWNANYEPEFYEMVPDRSSIVLYSRPKSETISNQPNLLLQKWAAPEFTATAKCDISGLAEGDIAGMINMGVTYAALAVRRRKGQYELITLSGRQQFEKEIASATDEENCIHKDLKNCGLGDTIYFRYHVMQIPSTEENADGRFTFPVPREQVTLSYSVDGKNFHPGISLIPEAGRWVGVKEGLFICNESGADGGRLAVDYFRAE